MVGVESLRHESYFSRTASESRDEKEFVLFEEEETLSSSPVKLEIRRK